MNRSWSTLAMVATLFVFGAGVSTAEASHAKEHRKKHKIVYHLNEAGVDKANAVLVNIQNHVDTLGWQRVEALELVVHGPAIKTFLKQDLDPDVKGKLEALFAGGLKFGGCRIAMNRQKVKFEDLVDGITAVPSGVVRLMELQERGYAYIKP